MTGRSLVAGDRLAATKLRPPSEPAGTFTRPRLEQLLDNGVRGALTLVVGPAGSGKTVLVSSWARRTELPVAWLALEPTDATPRRFWSGVISALAAAGAEGLPKPGAGVIDDELVADLIDALDDRDEPYVLVLDDFHEVGGAIAPEVDRLLERPPAGLRLVVASRRDPPLRLQRLRLASVVTEIRVTDLACTPDETATLLRLCGIRLADSRITRLWQRTEGWMAALTLAAISMRDSDDPGALVEQFDGEDLAISEYLMAEVLSRQPPEVQDFLVRTSIVDVLDGSLVEALTGEPDGHHRLSSLARNGVLVTPIDRRARWFRYHALFRELLQAEMRWTQPDALGDLHRRAAAWYAREGDDIRAVRHAIDGKAWDLAANLAADRWVELLLTGDLDVLAPLLDAIPEPRIAADPALAVALAAVSVETELPERAAERVRSARTVLSAAQDGDGSSQAGMALVELLHARHAGERRRALEATLAVLDRHGAASTGLRPELRSLVLTYLGTAESWTGQVTDARDHLREALAAAMHARSPWLQLLALGYLAGAESTCGDIPAARRRADQALELAHQHGWTRTSPAGAAAMVGALIATLQCRYEDATRLVAIAERAVYRAQDRPLRAAIALPKLVLLAADGRVEDALDVVRASLAELGDWPLDMTIVMALRAWEARLMAAAGDRDGARRALDAAAGPEALLVLSTRARMLIDDGDPHAARATLAPGLTLQGPMFTSILLDLWLVNALAHDRLHDRDAAAASLERALDLAEPGELLRPIVSHGDAILPLLQRHARHATRHRAFVDRAISLIDGRPAIAETSAGPLEPLSTREREVLGYLPTIMSNAEIAAELYVSVNTVKTHMRAIYRKLGVDNRRQAVARARQLKLFGAR